MLSRGARQAYLPAHKFPALRPQRYGIRLSQCPTRRYTTDKGPRFSANPVHEQLSTHAAFTVRIFLRWLKYSTIGIFAVGLTSFTAFEGVHMYVENSTLAPETDEEVRKWQWDAEAERWTGGEAGGTDPGLGFFGRHAVRAAWMAQNWGIGTEGSVMSSNAFTGRAGAGVGGLNIVEARLEVAQAFLNIALQHAKARMSSESIRPQTIMELLARHANIMERMGQRDALYEARSEYERVWAGLPGKGVDAARIALKLGDVNRRLGDYEDALAWWSRTVQLVYNQTVPSQLPAIPSALPSEPLAQRTMLSVLVSLSAYYSTTGQLRQAQTLQESALNVIRSLRQPESLEAASPPEALHALFVLHRSSLLSIHLAEVLYALRKKQTASMEWLTRAASSAERVALVLTGLPPIHPDAPESKIPHPPSSDAPLVTVYAKSNSMSKPAGSLLRDARRTAAEAWNLMGILSEGSEAPRSMERAQECYERALGWAGVAADGSGNIGKAGEGTLETEWKALWNNYVRARAAVKVQELNKK
ncbi:hypothetical protein NM688_g368 [Phlebia brevispora]|uniref:Uncharacterized protein n=1 Tax=Phlebia brevispora TaxID=194682 RepID=A0ACC1TEN9_9APHY|nr:hypothetical protein NM688_g368 [Phlebia brevispora]